LSQHPTAPDEVGSCVTSIKHFTNSTSFGPKHTKTVSISALIEITKQCDPSGPKGPIHFHLKKNVVEIEGRIEYYTLLYLLGCCLSLFLNKNT
jgi:hypothetical protein